jgi:CheY-like chemotaxis protein
VRVLIVEDEVKMASLIRRGLREDGMAADVAIKGEDALWMAGATDYDAIVLDVMLPGMDGFEVCRRLRDSGGRLAALAIAMAVPGVVLIVLTSGVIEFFGIALASLAVVPGTIAVGLLLSGLVAKRAAKGRSFA